MEPLGQIRRAHDREEVSVRALAKRFGMHRRTVRQAIASAIPPEQKPPPARVAPVLGPWKPIIDGWFKAEKELRGSGVTPHRVFERLAEEQEPMSASRLSVCRSSD